MISLTIAFKDVCVIGHEWFNMKSLGQETKQKALLIIRRILEVFLVSLSLSVANSSMIPMDGIRYLIVAITCYFSPKITFDVIGSYMLIKASLIHIQMSRTQTAVMKPFKDLISKRYNQRVLEEGLPVSPDNFWHKLHTIIFTPLSITENIKKKIQIWNEVFLSVMQDERAYEAHIINICEQQKYTTLQNKYLNRLSVSLCGLGTFELIDYIENESNNKKSSDTRK